MGKTSQGLLSTQNLLQNMAVTLHAQRWPGNLKEVKNDNNTWHPPVVCIAGIGLLRSQNIQKYMAVKQMQKNWPATLKRTKICIYVSLRMVCAVPVSDIILHLHVRMHVCKFATMCGVECVYVCMYVCVFMFMCVCVFVCKCECSCVVLMPMHIHIVSYGVCCTCE